MPRTPKKNYIPDEVVFRTKPQIALALVDRALANGVRVQAWTFDEGYGRDTAFLDGLEQRGQVFVGEVPTNFPRLAEKAAGAPQDGRIAAAGPPKVITRGWRRGDRRCSASAKLWRVIRPSSASEVAALPHQGHPARP